MATQQKPPDEGSSASDCYPFFIRRPGRGWRHVNGSVWDHDSGMRLHLLGLLKLPSGETVTADMWPEYLNVRNAVRIAGGSRKRGLMIWAMATLQNEGVAVTQYL